MFPMFIIFQNITEVDIPDAQIADAIVNSKFNLEKLSMSNFAFNPEALISMIPRWLLTILFNDSSS